MDKEKLQGAIKGFMDWTNFIQDVGYGIANIFGQGENANNVMNTIKSWVMGSNYGRITRTASTLITQIAKTLGMDYRKLNQVLAVIDQALGSLPPGLSQNLKQAVSSAKEKYLGARKDTVQQLNRVENSMNTALSVANSQDYSNPSNKLKNQDTVDSLIKENRADFNSIERKMN